MRKHLWIAIGLAVVLIGALVMGRGLAAPTADGDLDPTFGTGGKVTTDFAPGNGWGNAVAIQPDGKIVVVGQEDATGGGDFAVARYNADGTLDSGFGSGGKVTTDFEGRQDAAYAVLIQPDGKILTAGKYDDTNSYPPAHGFALVRYLPDGHLDLAFGTDGKVATDMDSYAGGGEAHALALQSDGKIVVAGIKIYDVRPGHEWSKLAVGRYTPDGQLDSSFGTGGLVYTLFGDLGDTSAIGYATAIQPDGKILVGGTADDGFALARYNADGSLDTTFGSQGLVLSRPGVMGATGMVLQPDGTIVLGGEDDFTLCAPPPCQAYRDFALMRYLPDGKLDPSFGTDGLVTLDVAGGYSRINGLVRQTDGRLIAAGAVSTPTTTLPQAFALARFNADGTIDSGFGNGGQLVTPFGASAGALGVALQTDGKIVAAGINSPDGNQQTFALARYQNALPPPPTPTIGPGCLFSDVCPGDYFFPGVQALLTRGAISGYADQTFRPYNLTTRAQLVKIVTLGFGLPLAPPPAGQYTFADVPPSHPFFAVIETAAAHNLVGGYTCGGPGESCDDQHRPYFRPAANVTRGQLAKIVVTAAGWPLLDPPSGTFADVAPGAAFYTDVETAAAQGILSGYGCGGPGEPCDGGHRPYFRPGANATRGQIAKITANALAAGASPTPSATAVPATPSATATTTALPPRKGGH